jgi:hypothetical protein
VNREKVCIKRDKYIKEVEKAKSIKNNKKEEKNRFIFIFLLTILIAIEISKNRAIAKRKVPVIPVINANLFIFF